MPMNNWNDRTGYGDKRRDDRSNMRVISKEEATKIFSKDDNDGSLLFEKAETLASMMRSVNETQIRRIYSEFGRIHSDFRNLIKKSDEISAVQDKSRYQLKHMKARLVYAKARSNSLEVFCDNFTTLIDAAIAKGPANRISENGDYVMDRLKNFFEATLAYHKQR